MPQFKTASNRQTASSSVGFQFWSTASDCTSTTHCRSLLLLLCFTTSPSGWMDCKTFIKWLLHFQHVHVTFEKNVLLILDNHVHTWGNLWGIMILLPATYKPGVVLLRHSPFAGLRRPGLLETIRFTTTTLRLWSLSSLDSDLDQVVSMRINACNVDCSLRLVNVGTQPWMNEW